MAVLGRLRLHVGRHRSQMLCSEPSAATAAAAVAVAPAAALAAASAAAVALTSTAALSTASAATPATTPWVCQPGQWRHGHGLLPLLGVH